MVFFYKDRTSVSGTTIYCTGHVCIRIQTDGQDSGHALCNKRQSHCASRVHRSGPLYSLSHTILYLVDKIYCVTTIMCIPEYI